MKVVGKTSLRVRGQVSHRCPCHDSDRISARLVDVTVLDREASIALLDAALRAGRPDDDRLAADWEAAGRLAGLFGRACRWRCRSPRRC
jgi:hypothetical protein